MYLSDRDVEPLLKEMNIVCDDPEHPFDSSEQVQPCSIDLRLSNIFWEPIPHKTIDLRRSRLLDLAPRRFWRRKVLSKGAVLTLRPGKLILGRVYEKFSIPSKCAGKIEGRSSFARLGLAVHCSADFLNPGYRGHMPLQLVNHSTQSLKLVPFLPICQLLLIPLSSEPSRTYGTVELQSKYMDDDGGPSYWWRDKRIRRLQAIFREADISLQLQEDILDQIGPQEPEVIERFESFIGSAAHTDLENSEVILSAFLARERAAATRDRVARAIAYTAFPILASAVIGSVFIRPFVALHVILWVLAFLTLIPFLYAIWTVPPDYLSDRRRVSRPTP